jgi:hypothetical protein
MHKNWQKFTDQPDFQPFLRDLYLRYVGMLSTFCAVKAIPRSGSAWLHFALAPWIGSSLKQKAGSGSAFMQKAGSESALGQKAGSGSALRQKAGFGSALRQKAGSQSAFKPMRIHSQILSREKELGQNFP